MTEWAIVRNDIMVNVVEWDGVTPWSPAGTPEVIALPAGAGIGYRRVDATWVPPEPASEDA